MKPIYAILPLLSVFICACNEQTKELWRGTVITSFDPMTAKVQDTITIYGENFKPVNTNTVIFSDNRIARVVDWSNTRLRVLVPDSGVVNGPISVRVGVDEVAVSKQAFIIDDSQPVIISMTPDHGRPGDIITVKGANFAKEKQDNKVFLGGVEAVVAKQEGRTLEVEVPRDVVSGEVDVIVKSNGVASEPKKFEVGAIFKDNFNRIGTLEGDWRIIAGSWKITDQYVSNVGGGTMLYNVDSAVLEVGDGHNFRLSTDIRIDVAAGTCFAGIIFNAQDESRFYLLRISGEGLVQLLATEDGGANWPGVFCSENAPIFGGDDFYHVEISSDIMGIFHVKISKKEDVLFEKEINDPNARFNGGYAGLWSLDDHSHFDNFHLVLK